MQYDPFIPADSSPLFYPAHFRNKGRLAPYAQILGIFARPRDRLPTFPSRAHMSVQMSPAPTS